MHGTGFVSGIVGVLLASGLAGCVQEESAGKSLSTIFGKDLTKDKKTNIVYITKMPLQADMGKGWTQTPNETIEFPTETLTKTAMTPAEPGGTTVTLPLTGETARTVKVRFNPKYDLAGYRVSWGLADAEGTVETWETPVEPGVREFSLQEPEQVRVKARLLSGSTVLAETKEAIVAGLSFRWTYASSVWPNGASAGEDAEPPTWDQAADFYKIAVPSEGAALSAETSGRGGPTDGTDVDLQFNGGGKCYASTTETAKESLSHPASAGAWEIRVGSVDCSSATPPYSYANAGPVPYQVIITLSWASAPGDE